MIHVLAISGSPVKDGNTEALLKEALAATSADPEVQSAAFNLSGLAIAGCKHCNWCLKH